MTALAATIIPAAGTNPPAVKLEVTGAPNAPTTAYSSNFTAGTSSWVAGTATISNDTTPTPAALYVRKAYPAVANTVYTATRVVTGLVIGTTYRYRAAVKMVDSGQIRLYVVGSTTGSFVTTQARGQRVFTEISFTATATSHTIGVGVQWTGSPLGANPGWNIDTVTVTPSSTWPGTRILRTDANGINVEVRTPAEGLDVVAGAMTLYDLEAALYGPVRYLVVDGNGVFTGVTVGNGAGLRNEFPNPATNDGTTYPFIAGSANVTMTLSSGVPNPDVVPTTAWRFELAASATSASLMAYIAAGVIPATEGEYWAVRISLRRLVGSPNLSAIFQLYAADAAGLNLGVVDLVTVPVPEGKWGTFDLVPSGPMPAGTASVRLYLRNSGTWAAGSVLFASAVAVGRVSGVGVALEGYVDGDLPADPPGRFNYVWLQGNTTSKRVPSVRLEPARAGLPWLSTPGFDTNPLTGTATGVPVASVLNYSETEERTGDLRKVINRRDPVGNPGVMTLRKGQLSLWFATYGEATAARRVLERGQTVLMRQPDFPGLDLYLSPGRLTLEPASLDTVTIRWQLNVDYDEVAIP